MSNNILSFSEYFSEKNIQYSDSSGQIIIQCPFCKKEDANGAVATYNIDYSSGKGSCSSCEKHADFKETVRKMGFEEEITVDGGFVTVIQHLAKSSTNKKDEGVLTIENGSSFKFHSIGDILRTDYGKTEWLVDKIIPIETISIISGDPQNYKTWITMELAKCVEPTP